MSLEAIRYDAQKHTLTILDQLRLPHESEYVSIASSDDGWKAIKDMVVRGAPAIAIVAILSLAVELVHGGKVSADQSAAEVGSFIAERLDYLNTSRPTAVNLSDAVGSFKRLVETHTGSAGALIDAYLAAAHKMLVDDVQDNRNIGRYGLEWIQKHVPQAAHGKVSALTICNTGSLATAGYGTALGIIRALHEAGVLERVYALETRPYNQGSRLTAYELVHDGIPATLVTDSMAAALLRKNADIGVVIVGADRVVLNGDTANKIGTFQLSILANHFDRKFIVAAPTTSIDVQTKAGEDIEIEERPAIELTQVKGVDAHKQPQTVSVAAPGIEVWNPAFDYVPYQLIDAIVTEKGVAEKTAGEFHLKEFKSN
ncbi:Methylthioribose-1-phosphate isomerase [Yarrowia sp. B02]|nr:Methylthioribose-1-phosphate isomerase [Yarrowia sp. B02]